MRVVASNVSPCSKRYHVTSGSATCWPITRYLYPPTRISTPNVRQTVGKVPYEQQPDFSQTANRLSLARARAGNPPRDLRDASSETLVGRCTISVLNFNAKHFSKRFRRTAICKPAKSRTLQPYRKATSLEKTVIFHSYFQFLGWIFHFQNKNKKCWQNCSEFHCKTESSWTK